MSLNTYSIKTVCGIARGTIRLMILGFGIEHLITCLARYDKDGFDRRGFDRDGFNRYGFNSEGYDRLGFNIDGFNKAGYDRSGYDCEGYDYQGFGRDRYNCSGVDRAGCCRQFYASYIEQLRERLSQAFQQMQYRKYRYALHDARVVLEEALKLLVQHVGGQAKLGDKILVNLKICENRQILDIKFIDRLHGARKICNINGHEFGADSQLTHNQVYFVVMQVCDLLNEAENLLVNI